jgi:adenine/guanine phosphoribosyltransferase-like PRPP-binding protein
VRVLEATGDVPTGREYHPHRYRSIDSLAEPDVLLLDDTWTTGGHAQSAAAALRAAGARKVALVVIGRHLRRDWEVVIGGPTCGELFDELPKIFDWSICTVH